MLKELIKIQKIFTIEVKIKLKNQSHILKLPFKAK
jgi:hypothetical protein